MTVPCSSLLLIAALFAFKTVAQEAECDAPPSDAEFTTLLTDRRIDPKSWADRYDVYNCPPTPPPGYPQQWSAQYVLGKWHTNSTEIPETIHQGLCILDATTDYETAMRYLEADLPFVVRNNPEFLATAQRWNQPGYIDNMLGDTKYPTHKSQDFQFKYWVRKTHPPEGWTEPTEVLRIPYREYADLAAETVKSTDPHYYLYAEGHWSLTKEEVRWPIFEELPQFKPDQFDLYQELFNQDTQKLHCKFGMTGNTAISHFDTKRNTIVLLKGRKRYLLADPTQCPKYRLHKNGHPSARSTRLDWTELLHSGGDNKHLQLQMNEVVMQPGDVLILPSYWFHSIVGLTHDSAQCNAWSMATMTYKDTIMACANLP